MLYSTFEAQFMNKLSNTEAESEKSVAYKKVCISDTFEEQWNFVLYDAEKKLVQLLLK